MADLPYLCDFETETENANWTLNPAVDEIITENRWVIGNATAYTGEKSMYVSQDNGLTNKYAATNNVLLAYRDITLEAGDYDIAYDWMGTGNKTKGYLKIIYASRPTNGLKCVGNATEPNYVSTSVQLMGNNTSLVDGDSWRHVQARVTIPVAQANKTTTRLLFIWVNTDVTKVDSLTTIAIDNFQLAKASPTGYPTNIHVVTSLGTSVVSWDGEADSYEVMYRQKGESEFTSLPVDGNSVSLENVEYGAYEFWICAVNGEDKSLYTVFPTVYIYETDCFDALNMYNAQFEYGKWNYRTGKEVQGTERVDFGAPDIRSRHTTHFDRNEVDPRTVIKNGRDTVACLKTVPSGEFGSVRLGNWNTGSEYESVTYHYTPESNSNAVLLIKYAIVLENPDHQDKEQPRFTLDVLNAAGEPIDIECASVDFHSPTPQEWQDPKIQALWHTSQWVTGTSSSRTVMWQDWKVIGISLEDYIGETLTITFTAYDCDQGGHFGYAYFMINCARSDVDGLPWGDGSTTQMFTAPEGFNYAWFNRDDVSFSDTISVDRYFYVQETDTNTYLCHVTYPTNPACGYWFDASAKPHNVQAELGFKWTPHDCINGFTFYNRCHVVLTNQETGEIEHRYDKTVNNSVLVFEDGTQQTIGYPEGGVYVPMPDEGGTVKYEVRTGVYVNNQLFGDTAKYEFEVPAIAPQEIHLYDSICRGENIIFPEDGRDKRTETGDYVNPLKSLITGCDSTIIMHLTVHEPALETIYDTICPGGTYNFNGRILTGPGRQTMLLTSLVTGCDSVLTLNLAVAQRPKTHVLTDRICADEPLILATDYSEYALQMELTMDELDTTITLREPNLQSVLFLNNKSAGQQKALAYITMPWCDTTYVDTLLFNVNLSNSIVELHFDDVLTFLSPEYNGGLTFTSYQWYADGQPIEGATDSYYYLPDMDWNTEYSVRVTLADGSEAWVCPFTPEQANRTQDVEEINTDRNNKKIIRNGHLVIIVNDREYTAQGQRIK